MSAEAADGDVANLTRKLRDTLIAMGKLTPQNAASVDELVRVSGLGFEEAAVHLGFVTTEELLEITAANAQSRPKQSESIIEGVLLRSSANRNLPVEYVRTVKPGLSLMLAHRPEDPYSEQIRTLRTELLLLNSASRHGVVMGILSACQGEGRTRLCAELAIAFSQLGQRTLLVDADLRRPRIHSLFETERTLGLGQSLSSGHSPELLGVENLPHLSVLVAGPSVPNPLELLTNGHFQRQMADLRRNYSMIIIDTPPISEFADGLAIASFAEQVLIVGRSGSTPHKSMKEMLRRMGGTQARIVGAVFNSF